MGESSMMVPTLMENWRLSCRLLHCHRNWFLRKLTFLLPQRGRSCGGAWQSDNESGIRRRPNGAFIIVSDGGKRSFVPEFMTQGRRFAFRPCVDQKPYHVFTGSQP